VVRANRSPTARAPLDQKLAQVLAAALGDAEQFLLLPRSIPTIWMSMLRLLLRLLTQPCEVKGGSHPMKGDGIEQASGVSESPACSSGKPKDGSSSGRGGCHGSWSEGACS
jgi:hypothetical protein